jgi:hypothetical protein
MAKGLGGVARIMLMRPRPGGLGMPSAAIESCLTPTYASWANPIEAVGARSSAHLTACSRACTAVSSSLVRRT